MPSVASVLIHPSQFPEALRQDLLNSLRTRCVNHKFHYDTPKQTLKWLALHAAHSPARTDANCRATYDAAFAGVAERLARRTEAGANPVHLLGLGCGGGQKDAALLQALLARSISLRYTPSDVSTAMVLVAREATISLAGVEAGQPVVCDLATAPDLPELIDGREQNQVTRIVTFFGMIPNFEPDEILPRLARLVRPGDWLLLSANLAPGADYAAGVRQVLPQYDNALTREWLLAFLFDLGVELRDGGIRFTIEDEPGLKRIVARFHFAVARSVSVFGTTFDFRPGEAIRLFYSYRYQPEILRIKLRQFGLAITDQWVTESGEEGVFLCRREAA